ncbi:MAG: hypothetical protein LBM03_00295 [Erysipelotrichaceae bacterium]|nr:hypothetical protein [Erysipelotrichaceae bacterium]
MKIIILLMLGFLTSSIGSNVRFHLRKNNKIDEEKNIINSDRDELLYYETSPISEDTNNEVFTNENDDFSIDLTPSRFDRFVPNQSYLIKYYKNLNQNTPYNSFGICGYTGISMLLSFYDTYWNDAFIPEQYDSIPTQVSGTMLIPIPNSGHESPGVWNDIDDDTPTLEDLKADIVASGITDVNSTLYKEALEEAVMDWINERIESGSFLGKLFEVALAEEVIVTHDASIGNPYLSGIGVNNEILNTVLSGYIDDNDALTNTISISTSKINTNATNINAERERIRDEIIELVQEGKPVLIGGSHYTDVNNNGIYDLGTDTEFGHVAVAYEYDEENDILYGNMGWSTEDSTYYDLDSYFNIEYSDYWSLNFDLLESINMGRTDNYIFTRRRAFYSPGLKSLFNIIKPEDYDITEQTASDVEIESDIELSLSNNLETVSTKRLRCLFEAGNSDYDDSIYISPANETINETYMEYTFSTPIKSVELNLAWRNNGMFDSVVNYTIEYEDENENFVEMTDLMDLEISSDKSEPSKLLIVFPESVTTFRIHGEKTSSLILFNLKKLAIFDVLVEYDQVTRR